MSHAIYPLCCAQCSVQPCLISEKIEEMLNSAQEADLWNGLGMALMSLGETACGHLSKLVFPTRSFRVTVLVEAPWCGCQVKAGEFILSRRKSGCRAFAQEGILLKAGISRCYYTCISVQTRSHAPPHSAGWKGAESKASAQPLNLSSRWRATRALTVRTGCCSGLWIFLKGMQNRGSFIITLEII